MATKYVTPTELRAYRPPLSTSTPDFTSWTDDQLEIIINEIEAELESKTNQIFNKLENQEILMDGTGRTKLFFKESGMAFPVLSVSKVEEVEFDGTLDNLLTVGKHYVFDPKKPYYVIWNRDSTSARNGFTCGGGWPLGLRNIKVTANVGYETTPILITKAIKLWAIAQTLGSEEAGFTSDTGEGNKRQEVWEDYTVTHGAGASVEKRRNYAIPNVSGYWGVDKLIAEFINMTGLFIAI